MQLDANNPPDKVDFNGVWYCRMGGQRRYYLSQSKKNSGRRGAKGLHVAIWEYHSGQSVPAGHEIHHRNGGFGIETSPPAWTEGLFERLMGMTIVERIAVLERIEESARAAQARDIGLAN